jgi:L-Ala-D/L-Glu epimerase
MISISDIECFQAKLPFRYSFKHGAAERSETESVFVVIRDKKGNTGYGEGCTRAYVTGETIDSAAAFLKRSRLDMQHVKSQQDLKEYTTDNSDLIDRNPAAWCAAELAFLDLFAKARNKPVESLFGLPQARPAYQYSAVLGDSEPAAFHKQYHQYRKLGFTDFKIKLSPDLSRDMEKVAIMRNDSPGISVRADANNLWTSADEAAAHIAALDVPLWAIEEPLMVGQMQELHELYRTLGIKVILDESFLKVSQIGLLSEDPGCWIVNIRISKMGGLLRSLETASALLELGVPIIVGAQVGETSLLTRAALPVADAAAGLLRAQEGAFGTLLLGKDPFRPVFQFEKRGYLPETAINHRGHPGFGLEPATPFREDPDFLPL